MIKGSPEHHSAHPAETGGQAPRSPRAGLGSSAQHCQTLTPTSETPRAPQPAPPAAFWVTKIPSQPRCCCSQLDARLLWQRVPRDEIPISYFFFSLVKKKIYKRLLCIRCATEISTSSKRGSAVGTAWGRGVHKDEAVDAMSPPQAWVTPSLAMGDPLLLSGMLPTFLQLFPPLL